MKIQLNGVIKKLKNNNKIIQIFSIFLFFIFFNSNIFAQVDGWKYTGGMSNDGSYSSSNTIGDNVEWWQSIIIIFITIFIIRLVFKKTESTPFRVTSCVVGGIVIISAIPPGWGPWIFGVWCLISWLANRK